MPSLGNEGQCPAPGHGSLHGGVPDLLLREALPHGAFQGGQVTFWPPGSLAQLSSKLSDLGRDN